MICQFDPNKRFVISKTEIENLNYTVPIKEEDRHTRSQKNIRNTLENVINPWNGFIDGDKLKKAIFPINSKGESLYFDVFISHSHNDLESAKLLAAYLRNKLGMFPFIDNYVWGSADRLLKTIDNKYCRNNQGGYNYEKRNFSTSHVHTMLSMAIMEMISKCRHFIFIESNESINYNALQDSGEKTQSPWLYQELQFANMLSVAIDRQINGRIIEKSFSATNLQIEYTANTKEFTRLTAYDLRRKVLYNQSL